MGNPAASLLYWISIHALREESDHNLSVYRVHPFLFQSTLSVRRATPALCAVCAVHIPFQSTLSVRRATLP